MLLITVSSRLIELTGLVTEVSEIELNFELGIMAHFFGLPVTKPPNQEKNALLLGLQKDKNNGKWISQKEKSVLKQS